jgi:multiple sugar transport system permease protein
MGNSLPSTVGLRKSTKRGGFDFWRIPVPYLFIAPAILVLFATTIYPLIFSLNLSFRDYNIIKPQLGMPFVGLSNYGEVITSAAFRNDLLVTLKFVVGSVTLSLAIGVGLALFFNRPLKGLHLIRTLILLPMITTPVVVGLIWRWLYNPELGLVGYFMQRLGLGSQAWLTQPSKALPVMIATDVWQWSPFVFLIVYAAMQSLPEEPYEAAQIDGASGFRILLHITLPQLLPTIMIVALLRTLNAVKVFDIIYIITQGGPGQATESLSLFVYKAIFAYNRMGLAAAASFLILFLTIALCRVFFEVLIRKQEE